MSPKTNKSETLVVINLVAILLFFLLEEKLILVVSFVLTLICLPVPAIGELVHKSWTWFFGIVGQVNATILLSVVFIVILVPTALLKKLFSSRRPVDMKSN